MHQVNVTHRIHLLSGFRNSEISPIERQTFVGRFFTWLSHDYGRSLLEV